jgi:hypothetical protein
MLVNFQQIHACTYYYNYCYTINGVETETFATLKRRYMSAVNIAQYPASLKSLSAVIQY